MQTRRSPSFGVVLLIFLGIFLLAWAPFLNIWP